MYDPDKNNYPDYIEKVYTFNIPSGQSPERIDRFLARSILNATRNKVQRAIDIGNVKINGKAVKASKKIQPGDKVECVIMKPPPIELVPENIPLDIVFEDEYLMVVNKPAGMVVHPGFGNRYGTLVNAVLYYLGEREKIEIESDDEEEENEGQIFSSESVRPGIVHRLDKMTSGLLIISKNPVVHAKLASQFEKRTVEKIYTALIWGKPEEKSGIIEGNIGRSSRDRKLFAVVKRGGKSSITEYFVREYFEFASLVNIKLHTGRTHQIRVHFSHNRFPVFGDRDYRGDSVVYGGHIVRWRNLCLDALKLTEGQLLHAGSISFNHPESNERIILKAEIPEKMKNITGRMRELSLELNTNQI